MKKFVLILFIFSVCISSRVFSQNPLDANGYPSNPNIVAGDCISFTDYSDGNPTYWKWTFYGAEPSESYLQHPQNICYYTTGTFDYVLEVQNETGVDTEIYYNAIVVESTTNPIAYFSADLTYIPKGTGVVFTNESQNGPFVAIKWEFQGGTPSTLPYDPTSPIYYNQVGDFDVDLTVKNEIGNSYTLKRKKYIHVVPPATNYPIVDFAADRTYIAPGDIINFTDFTKNSPYKWEWTFQGGQPSSSQLQNPSGIKYNSSGTYKVTLIATNSMGLDTLTKDMYIRVFANDPCASLPAPIADFVGSPRLISVGSTVFFQNKSKNYPTSWNWEFSGGNPGNSIASNITHGIKYNETGFYDVFLSVNDACPLHTSTKLKEKYIMVFSGPMSYFCDTISNLNESEKASLSCPTVSGTSSSWGYVSGLNSNKTISYAEKYKQDQFTEVSEIVFAVAEANKKDNNSYVTFCIWDGNSDTPDSLLAEKKVLIKDLRGNYWNSLAFDNPVIVNGPFFIGYTVNYAKGANSAANNPQFAVSLFNRGYNEGLNTFYIKGQDSIWTSAFTKYGYAASSSIAPRTCMIKVDDFAIQNNISIYPNPATDNVFINTGDINFGKDLFLSIYDMMGRLVYEDKTIVNGKDIIINTSNFNSGLYLVTMIIDKNRAAQKLLISK